MLFYIIISIVIVEFLLTQYLSFRNRKRMTPHIPEQLEGIYDQVEYAKQQSYQKINSRFSVFLSTISFFVLLLVLSFQLLGWLDISLRQHIANPILLTLAFVGIVYVINMLLDIPFEYYSTFTIEERFGFNKSTKRTFWNDQIKGLLLSVILGGAILALITWLFSVFGAGFWIYAWIAVTVFSLFMTLFYSNLIVPLFNKQTPLQEGELRNAIESFARKAGFELKNIYVMDASKRSSKANAYFTGFGGKKRIVLFDTLINDLSTAEIVAVLAHEIGHYKKKHIVKHLVVSVIYTGIMLYILSLFLNNDLLAAALGGEQASFHLGVIGFSILFTPISIVLGLFMNMSSRKNEYEADAYASKFGLSSDLISGLKKLSVKSLSNLNPDPLYVFFNYSHPTLLQRIGRLYKK